MHGVESMKNKFQISKLKLTKKDLLILIALIGLFLFTRLYQLDQLPIFADEAIYVRWSQVMQAEPSLRFLPLQDGKQPLFMWATIPFLKLFTNPLLAGRFVSILAGIGSLLSVLFLGYQLKLDKRELILLGLFYIWVPFVFFFERMALVDSLLSAFGLWSFNLSLLLSGSERLDVAMLLGFALGGGLLTKSPAKIFALLSILTVLIGTIKKFKIKRLMKRGFLLTVSLIIAFMMYNILRLGPNFHMIGLRNQDYIWSFSEVLQHPFRTFPSNMANSWRYYGHYLTWPLFFISIFGLVKIGERIIKNKKIELIFLPLWLFAPLLGISAIARTFTARYILFTVPLLIILIIYGLRLVKRYVPNKAYRLLIPLLFIMPIIFNYHLWHNPVKAGLPEDEQRGYLEDWTAGWGIEDIGQYLKAQPKDKNIIVGTEGHFGTLPDGLQIYVQDEPNITVIGVGLPIKDIPTQLKEAKQAGNEVYLVVNQSRFAIENWPELELTKVNEYNKPGGDSLLFFKLESK
jgi:4-amino-4-deoxy-L-arabinose transferase-like glycosyltransferase